MSKLICLDAGHGGRDPGACANNIIEKDFALDMVTRIGHHLRLRDMKTVLTRDKDIYVGIDRRAQIARTAKANFFLSIHCNASANKDAQGAEAYVAAPDTRSIDIAKDMLHRITQLKIRGVRKDNQSQHTRLGVLRGTYKQMPAVLLELGFCTNEHDAMLMNNRYQREAWSEQIALAIIDTIS